MIKDRLKKKLCLNYSNFVDLHPHGASDRL